MEDVLHIWMNVCIPNAYSLVPALKLFIEKGDKVNFMYPGTLNHFKYHYDVNLHAVQEKIIPVESTINIKEDLFVFSNASISTPKVVTSTPSPKALDVLPNIDLDISSIYKHISLKSCNSKYEVVGTPIASQSCALTWKDIVTIIEKIIPPP